MEKKNRNLLILILFIFFGFCNEPNGPAFDSSTILKLDSSEHKRIQFYPNDQIETISDSMDSKLFGNRYDFFENGYLQRYSFMADSIHSTYYIEFDSLGRKTKIMGDPIVYRLMSADEAPDTIYVKYIISEFEYRSSELFISDSLRKFAKIEPKIGGPKPFLKIYEVWKNVKNVNRVLIIAMFQGKNDNGETGIFYDTLDVSRNK